MNLEAISQYDLERIRHLQPDGWTDIVKEFEFYIQSVLCNPIKIELDGKIAGIGASIAFEKSAWLAHIIVDSNYRNKGIGFEIVNELIEQLKLNKSIETIMLIATEIGRPVYLKFGFKDVSNYLFMKREIPNRAIPIPSKIVEFSENYRSEIYKLDYLVSGEKREKLLDPFISTSKLYINNNKLEGFYMPALKEGLIYAETEVAGLELMNLKYATIDKAVLPSENKIGIEFLRQNGFVELPTKGTRMILGKDLSWKPKMMYSRIAGNFG
ncbi:MAG: GNAT family N-acetyltransferase [Bacteroidetes bacterium]|nr:GNAT family N-acetyltransferase [Bacteroidota bacterium]